MKRIILFSTTFLLSFCLFAQNEIHFGIKAGLNVSTQDVDNPLASYSYRPGFSGGAFFYFKFSNIIVQPEVLLSQEGTNITFENEKLYAKFNYVGVPIMLKYVFNSGLNVQFGPQIGFLLCARSNYHPVTNQKYKEQYYTTAYKSTDFLLSFGIGWDTQTRWIFDARYSLGVTSINNYDGIPDTKNNFFSLAVGYKLFKLGK